jgi:hypothetical protein
MSNSRRLEGHTERGMYDATTKGWKIPKINIVIAYES